MFLELAHLTRSLIRPGNYAGESVLMEMEMEMEMEKKMRVMMRLKKMTTQQMMQKQNLWEPTSRKDQPKYQQTELF